MAETLSTNKNLFAEASSSYLGGADPEIMLWSPFARPQEHSHKNKQSHVTHPDAHAH